jgi:hypothetical protein
MLIKILLKIWPAITPILLYIIWEFFIKKLINRIFRKNYCAKNNNSQSNNEEKIIEGEFVEVGDKKSAQKFESKSDKIFSLENKSFVITLYISLILAIACVISFGF